MKFPRVAREERSAASELRINAVRAVYCEVRPGASQVPLATRYLLNPPGHAALGTDLRLAWGFLLNRFLRQRQEARGTIL